MGPEQGGRETIRTITVPFLIRGRNKSMRTGILVTRSYRERVDTRDIILYIEFLTHVNEPKHRWNMWMEDRITTVQHATHCAHQMPVKSSMREQGGCVDGK